MSIKKRVLIRALAMAKNLRYDLLAIKPLLRFICYLIVIIKNPLGGDYVARARR